MHILKDLAILPRWSTDLSRLSGSGLRPTDRNTDHYILTFHRSKKNHQIKREEQISIAEHRQRSSRSKKSCSTSTVQRCKLGETSFCGITLLTHLSTPGSSCPATGRLGLSQSLGRLINMYLQQITWNSRMRPSGFISVIWFTWPESWSCEFWKRLFVIISVSIFFLLSTCIKTWPTSSVAIYPLGLCCCYFLSQ